MKLDSVQQLQGLNEMMKDQLENYPVSRVMILGIAGGNGLEHIRTGQFEKIYGADVNAAYLEAATERYPQLKGVLECLCTDLTEKPCRLPESDLVAANLLTEYYFRTERSEVIYAMLSGCRRSAAASKAAQIKCMISEFLIRKSYIGYECFQKVIRHVRPECVSCVIQINTEDAWVSDSPYLHVFDGLEQVHRQIEPAVLEKAMAVIGYQTVKRMGHGLPNGKKLLRMDFQRV